MKDSYDLREENKREIRGAMAFAEDAMRRANDSMELSPPDPVDKDYMKKQLKFVLSYTQIALRLVDESIGILDQVPDDVAEGH